MRGTGRRWGLHRPNPMNYTDNEDGTVTDNVTGLMWQKQDDGDWKTWSDAGAYCSSLGVGLLIIRLAASRSIVDEHC